MMPETTKPRKPAYKPHVRKVSDTEYTVQSERYTYLLYLVTVRCGGPVACECPAGQHGRMCKHQKVVAAYVQYRQNPTHLRPARMAGGVDWADLAAEFAALPAPTFNFRAQAQGEVARGTSAAGLLAAFGL